MRKINELLKKYELKPYRYQKKGKIFLIDTDNGKYVVKEKIKNNNTRTYEYLKSRNFNYYPKVLNSIDDDFEITEYVEEYDMPNEQKMVDLIDLIALLHNKTTHYKEIDEDDYKEIYEDLLNNIEYLTSYYSDLITIIESKVYMSPSEYLIARNISKIYAAINFSKSELEKWYELVKTKRKQRLVVLHNNLDIDHFIRNDNSYLVSWDKSRIDIPVFDIYKLYKRNGLDYEFSELLKRYEKSYPLLEEERKLLFILIALPDKLEFNDNEYNLCKNINKSIDMIYKTEMIISPYYTENGKENKN